MPEMTTTLKGTRKFTRMDTKALVGAVFLGIVFVLVQQVAHRIDAMIMPSSVIVGGVTWAIFTGLVVLLYEQPAGLITAELEAIIAIASGLSPLAVFFIPANGLASLVFSLVAWRFSMDKWTHHLLAQIASNVVGNICVGFGLSMVLHLPLPVILISSGITTLAGITGGTVLTKIIYDNVKKSGVV